MESSRKDRARRKLRPEWEMDNFFCSHRCTSDVRLWSGARSVCQRRRVPLYHVFFCFAFLPVLRSMPLPQYRLALYSLSLTMPSSVQNFERMPSTIPGVGAGTCLSRTQRRNVVRSTPKILAASETE